ncbi:hypothetical protein C2S51_006759, partial [Perilla frutescens var. frutescens]
VRFVKSDGTDNCDPCPPFPIKFPTNPEGRVHFLPGNESSTRSSNTSSAVEDDRSDKLELLVESYIAPDPGPYPQDQPKQNLNRVINMNNSLDIFVHKDILLIFRQELIAFSNLHSKT